MWARRAALDLRLDAGASVDGRDGQPRAFASGCISSLIWTASSRVGASTSTLGAGSEGLIISTSGTAKASVLPDPVGDLTSTSRPARTSGTTRRWTGNGAVMPRLGERLYDGTRRAEVIEGLRVHVAPCWRCALASPDDSGRFD